MKSLVTRDIEDKLEKNNQLIYSRRGFLIYKLENKLNLGKLSPLEKFIVSNIFGMEIGRFNSEADARRFLDQRIQQNQYVDNVLGIAAKLSQILILIGLLFSFFSGFIISFSYAVRYNQEWIFPRIISENYVKIFTLDFVFVIFIFYIPIIFVFLGKYIKKRKYYNFFYFYLFIPLISFIFIWPFFENSIDIKINYLPPVICIIYIGFFIYISNYFIENGDIKYFPVIIFIPVFILIFSPFFNFSRIVIKTIGMGDRRIFLQISPENPSKINPEFKILQSELKNYSGTQNIYCLFFQSGKSLYITKDPGLCENQSMRGDIGPLIRVPMKYVIAIGEVINNSSSKTKKNLKATPPSPSLPPAAGPR